MMTGEARCAVRVGSTGDGSATDSFVAMDSHSIKPSHVGVQ